MPWETRKGKKYYYRTVKRGGRVWREYWGCGPDARLAAALDAEERQRRAGMAAAFRDERVRAVAADAAAALFAGLVLDLLRAELVAAGYHQHARGHWRRRHGRDEQ
jgi:hypothetical protein